MFRHQITGELKSYIEELLVPQRTTDEFQTLRSQAKDYTYAELSRELSDQKKLSPLFKQVSELVEIANISDGSIMASYFLIIELQNLSSFNRVKRLSI